MRARLRAARSGLVGSGLLMVISCGGGGSSAIAPAPQLPTVTVTANPASVSSGQSSTLTWSSTNATSCTASGAWSGSEGTSGTASTGALTAPSTFTLSCTGSGGTAKASANVAITAPLTNHVALVVDPGPANRANTLFTTVTICVPGTSTCQTIDHVQVDTGSSGLRILSSVLSSSLSLTVQSASDGNALAECTQFVDGYSWGPIAAVDLTVGGETAGSMPVQIIGDAGFASIVPSACSTIPNPENTVAQFGANGILGISIFDHDCGPACAAPITAGSPGFYYSCTTMACSEIPVPVASQLPNPVTFFATNNNGVIIELGSVPAAGLATLSGTMIFGIDTQSNNQSGSQTIVTLNGGGDFTTLFNNQTLSQSFADSGSSGLYFNDSSLVACNPKGVFKGFYCPASTTTFTATLQGANAISVTESFGVANAAVLGSANPGFAVFGNLAGTYPSSAGTNTFDWGLPFYFGKTVYTAFAGATTAVGTGPYIAF